jgi:hypothetical protein
MKQKSITILDFSMNEIEKYLYCILIDYPFSGQFKNGLKTANVYFVGASLCIDVKGIFNGNSTVDVIVLNHSSETYNLFSGGLKMLLSIKALKMLEAIMLDNRVKHKTKWLS